MNKITIWGACFNGGDGSVSVHWFLTKEQAEHEEESQGEDCTFSVETFEGSNIHARALENAT